METESQALDQALMQRVLARDESALGDLYDRYNGLVYSVVLRVLHDEGAAEEILQDIFFQLWEKAGQFDSSRGSLPAWLLVIARNRAISRLRRHNPAESDDREDTVLALPSPYHLESEVARAQLLGRVRSALGELPASQREALELAYFEGMTHSEIAERTGEPLGTIKTRLRSAVETLKRILHP
jgi:RNA polymerase sigma-70 factor (ECF subfamily)